jgi:hypothetical protein
VISHDAPPAVTVTCPGASAFSTGGSSDDRLTMFGSLDRQISPRTAPPCVEPCSDRD